MAKTVKTCNSGIGGQAVMEGVMMKNNDLYGVAVRKPDGDIEIDTEVYHGVCNGSVLKKIPLIRGVFIFLDSLILGMRSLNFSAKFYEDGDAEETKTDRFLGKMFGDKAEKVITGFTVTVSIILAVAIFMILPYFLSSLFEKFIRNASVLAIVEGVIRLCIFLIYVAAIALMKDIRRVYMYHGAEHKCINCIEHGHMLNVQNVKKSSRFHRRCGTSFLLFVMLVSIVMFMFIRVDQPALRLILRLLLIPVIAGISYELIRFAGTTDNAFVRALSAPGLLLQRLTTKEPDEEMIEVGIKSVEAVFDWKKFLTENFDYQFDNSSKETEEAE